MDIINGLIKKITLNIGNEKRINFFALFKS